MRTIMIGAVIALLLLAACGTIPDENTTTPPPKENNTQIANPASVNCVNKGGELQIREGRDGQYGVCLIDGKECEEWALFRGEGCTMPCEDTYATCPDGTTYKNATCTDGKLIQVLYVRDPCYGHYVASLVARQGFTECTEESRTVDACTMDYAPVCADVDNGIRCFKAPCPNVDTKTFGNACAACANASVYGYVAGECAVEERGGFKPSSEGRYAVCDGGAAPLGYECVDACPVGYDSYKEKITICIKRYDQATIERLSTCEKKSDCTGDSTCGYGMRATTGAKLYWSGSPKDDNNQPVQAKRCLPQEYVRYMKATGVLYGVDELGRKIIV